MESEGYDIRIPRQLSVSKQSTAACRPDVTLINAQAIMKPPQHITCHKSCIYSVSGLMAVFFPGGPGLAGTRMSPFWILLELRLTEVVAVTTGAIRRAKLHSNRHQQQTNTQRFYRPDAFPVAQPCRSTEGNGPVFTVQ